MSLWVSNEHQRFGTLRSHLNSSVIESFRKKCSRRVDVRSRKCVNCRIYWDILDEPYFFIGDRTDTRMKRSRSAQHICREAFVHLVNLFKSGRWSESRKIKKNKRLVGREIGKKFYISSTYISEKKRGKEKEERGFSQYIPWMHINVYIKIHIKALFSHGSTGATPYMWFFPGIHWWLTLRVYLCFDVIITTVFY